MAYKKKKKTIVYQWKKGRVESLRRNMAAEKHPSMQIRMWTNFSDDGWRSNQRKDE